MTIITHDGTKYLPVLFGSIDSFEPSDNITCILDCEPRELDMFNKVVHHKIKVSDVKYFTGTLMTTPVIFPESHHKINSQTND